MTGPRFAALGDSLTSGIGDPVDGGWRGWAALLGEGGTSFRNFAVSGALTADVEERQAPSALDFGADIASVVIGANDTLRAAFDIEDIALRLDRVCCAFAAQGAVVLTACLPDPGAMLGLPGFLARPLARRQHALNSVVHALSARYDTVHLHMSDAAWVAERGLWSADRLHPGERGHRVIAARFHALLAERGLRLGAAPSLAAERRPPSRLQNMYWLATRGAAWVVRRCRDLLPELSRLAAAEVRHAVRGTTLLLDALADQALAAALAALAPPSEKPSPAVAAGGPAAREFPVRSSVQSLHGPGGASPLPAGTGGGERGDAHGHGGLTGVDR